jgi:hypothetical protein
MNSLLTTIFYLPMGLNTLDGLFYFIGYLLPLEYHSRPGPHSYERYVIVVASGAVLTLLAWAYQLAIVQGKTGAGFGVLGLSYLLWMLLLIIALFTFKRTWQ